MTKTIEPIEDIEDLAKSILVPREDFEAWMQKYDWTFHQLARGEFPEGFTNLNEFQLGCIAADPVLWCMAFLKDLDNPDEPYQFWDYQKESVRYRGNVLHEDGSEVGKSREIHALCLYMAFTYPRGSGLVSAPQTIYFIEIIDMILDQLLLNKELGKAFTMYRKKPHHHMRFSNGFRLDFRPTDFNGAPLRGVHAKTFAIMDEACIAKNKKIFDEFWRAAKPDCEFRLYSVPDGDRSCEYYRLCQKASGDLKEELDENELTRNLTFRKFHWPKTLMPAPFWSDKRRKSYIDQFGGEDSPGYQHNVLGNWGDPENSVFPWYQFQRLLKDIPEYRVLKILVDESQGEVSISGAQYQIKPETTDYTDDTDDTDDTDKNPESDPRLNREQNPKSVVPSEIILCDRRVRKADFDIKTETKAFFSNLPGIKFGGADLGFSQDPTEIYIKIIIGKTHRLIARVQLRGVTYDQQADAIDTLDDIYNDNDMKMGWGLDAGNAGTSVIHILQNQQQYFSKRYEDRLTGYQFGSTYEAVDENGEIIMDKFTNKPVKLSAKELSTDLLVKKMQRQEIEYPYDPDIALYYPNHTYRDGQLHRIYKKDDDHVIDADRALTLRVILPGDGGEDIFACG